MTANVQPPEDIDTDWASIALRAFMAIAVGAIEPADDEEPDPWAADMPGWRRAAAEYHRDRSGRLAVEIEPKRLERLRRFMAHSISLERVYEIGRNRATPAVGVEISRCRRLLSDDVSLERAAAEIQQHRLSGRAPAATVSGLVFSLRERGDAALAEPDCRRRLAEISTTQVREVIGRLIAVRPRYPAITDELIFRLGEQLPCPPP
jgi:hypothetical protein